MGCHFAGPLPPHKTRQEMIPLFVLFSIKEIKHESQKTPTQLSSLFLGAFFFFQFQNGFFAESIWTPSFPLPPSLPCTSVKLSQHSSQQWPWTQQPCSESSICARPWGPGTKHWCACSCVHHTFQGKEWLIFEARLFQL